MSMHYTDPKRESDPHALPDLETFNVPADVAENQDDGTTMERGWYWQACFPGCLPDGEPCGPFETEAEALADARDGMED